MRRHSPLLAALTLILATPVFAQTVEQAVMAFRPAPTSNPFSTLKSLVEIESGSDDREGLDRISSLIAEKTEGARRRGGTDRTR